MSMSRDPAHVHVDPGGGTYTEPNAPRAGQLLRKSGGHVHTCEKGREVDDGGCRSDQYTSTINEHVLKDPPEPPPCAATERTLERRAQGGEKVRHEQRNGRAR